MTKKKKSVLKETKIDDNLHSVRKHVSLFFSHAIRANKKENPLSKTKSIWYRRKKNRPVY